MLREDRIFLIKLVIITLAITALLILAYEKFAVVAYVVATGMPIISLLASLGVLLNAIMFGAIAARSGDVIVQSVFAALSSLMLVQIALFHIGRGGEFLLVVSYMSTMILASAGAHFIKRGDDPERATSHLIGAVCSTLMIAIVGG